MGYHFADHITFSGKSKGILQLHLKPLISEIYVNQKEDYSGWVCLNQMSPSKLGQEESAKEERGTFLLTSKKQTT